MARVAVIGAGTMGNGIAHVFAQAGYDVALFDTNIRQLENAVINIRRNLERQVARGIIDPSSPDNILNRIKSYSELSSAVKDVELAIEAATENELVKLQIFRDLDAFAPLGAILASNTSSISITKIAGATSRPGRIIGMHFMNPVPVMKLVEIINGFSTEKEVTEKIIAITHALEKVPTIANDFPGFISNRILMPMINEAILCLQESVGTVESIDVVMRTGMNHPMGPLQLADFIGLDVCLNILRVLQDGFGNPKYAPAVLLVNMVAAGDLGVKSGRGFYQYETGRKELLVSDRFR